MSVRLEWMLADHCLAMLTVDYCGILYFVDEGNLNDFGMMNCVDHFFLLLSRSMHFYLILWSEAS